MTFLSNGVFLLSCCVRLATYNKDQSVYIYIDLYTYLTKTGSGQTKKAHSQQKERQAVLFPASVLRTVTSCRTCVVEIQLYLPVRRIDSTDATPLLQKHASFLFGRCFSSLLMCVSRACLGK
jgi:hypothetical protein